MGDRPNMLWALVASTRPRQWTKNLLLFSAVIFAGRFTEPAMLLRSAAAFVVFCAASGALYLVNDVRDRVSDREHAAKRLRPIASGELPVPAALVGAGVLAAAGLGGAYALGVSFAAATLGFVALELTYTFYLKRQVILDVMAIAGGFVLRAGASMLAIGAPFSPWLLACAGLLALLLALGKRRHELLLLQGRAGDHRVTLDRYTTELIDQMLSAVTSATIVSYALYTFFSTTSQHHGYLMLTVPFVVYGILRYVYLVYDRGLGGNPEELLLTDRPLMADIALWLVTAIAAMSV